MKNKFRKVAHVLAIIVCTVALIWSVIFELNYKYGKGREKSNLTQKFQTEKVVEDTTG